MGSFCRLLKDSSAYECLLLELVSREIFSLRLTWHHGCASVNGPKFSLHSLNFFLDFLHLPHSVFASHSQSR